MQEYHYFVAHEFSKQKRDDLREAIEEAFKGSGLRAYYADMEVRQKHILDKIGERMLATRFGIYDVTDGNPNVCLELGIARGAKKPYYIIHEKGTKLPADLEGLDRIDYESYKELTRELKKKVVKKEMKRFMEVREILRTKQESYEKIQEEEVIEKYSQLYQAEALFHGFGNEVEDADALNKRAWYADLSVVYKHIIFGPYEMLPETGNYIAFFRMKLDNNSSVDPILLLDVTGGGFASKIVRGIDFHEPNKYQLFGLKFRCRVRKPMEYRVFNNILWPGKIWIDYVAIVKAEAQPKEPAKAFAEESQRLKEKEEAIKKHTDFIYNEIVRLLGRYSDFVVQVGDWLSCLDPDKFPKELASHLETYNALSIASNAKELCKSFNADLEKAIDDTIKEFIKLVENPVEEEHAEGKKFSLQRYDIVPHPDRYYSPDILAWNIYHNTGRFEPYEMELTSREGWFKIGNTVALTDNRTELESFIKLANEYSLKKREIFEKFYDRRKEAIVKIEEFFDALREIKKELDSGHQLKGRCYLCPEIHI